MTEETGKNSSTEDNSNKNEMGDDSSSLHQDGIEIDPSAEENELIIPKEEYENLINERDDFKDRYLRKTAELDNVIRRTSKEKHDLAKFGNENFIRELLPVLDSLDKAIPESKEEGSKEQDDSYHEGLNLVKKQLLDVFSKNGVEEISDVGKPFDPNRHQAIQKVEQEDISDEVISQQFQKGYLLNGRLIRPAMVVVAIPSSK